MHMHTRTLTHKCSRTHARPAHTHAHINTHIYVRSHIRNIRTHNTHTHRCEGARTRALQPNRFLPG